MDEAVVVAMGSEAEAYPATLLEVAKLAFKRPKLALGLIGIVESKSALGRRIKHLIDRPVPKTARLGFSGLAALLLAGAAFLPMARGQRTPDQPPSVVSESGPQPAVKMEVKFIELEESELAVLGLGEPTLIEFNGHRAWALTPAQLNEVLQRALEQTGADVLTAPRLTTFSGRQSQIQVVEIVPIEGTEIRVGPTCDLIPYVSGELIRMRPTKDAHAVLEGVCPVVASFGGRDRTLKGRPERLESALRDLGIPHDVKVYPEASHGFMNRHESGLGRVIDRVTSFGFRPEEAEDAWRRIFAFFGEHLRG